MCSNTTFSSGISRRNGFITRSMKTASRSKISISGSVTSPWTRKGMPSFLHHFQRLVALGQIRHAGRGIGRRSGRIQFDGMHHTAISRALNFFRRRVIGQIQDHQWLEFHPCRQSRQNAVTICDRLFGGRYRRFEVRHHDRTGKLARRVRQYRCNRCAIAQVQMPVVRTCDGDAGGLFGAEFVVMAALSWTAAILPVRITSIRCLSHQNWRNPLPQE
jgi:hypothetical protein